MFSRFTQSASIVFLFLSTVISQSSYAGAGSGGGGDAKAIEFLSYSKAVCSWMATDVNLSQYSAKCTSTIADIEASLGDYNRKARLAFVPDQLKDENGVPKPAFTSGDGYIQINSDSWIQMTASDRARTAALEVQVLCQVDNRYQIADTFGDVWDLQYGTNRPLMDIPVGTKLRGYVKLNIPANTNTLLFADKSTTTFVSLTEIFGNESTLESNNVVKQTQNSTTVQSDSSTTIIDQGHVFSLGDAELLPNSHGFEGQVLEGIAKKDQLDLPDFGMIVLMPSSLPQDSTIQNLTITGFEKADHPSTQAELAYSVMNPQDGSGYIFHGGVRGSEFPAYLTVTMNAVSDLNPNAVIKIIAFVTGRYHCNGNDTFGYHCTEKALQAHGFKGASNALTLKLLQDELSRHFAIVFPDSVSQ